MRAVGIAALSILALAACSKGDQADVKADSQTVVEDVKQSAKDVAGSPAVENLKAETKEAVSDTGTLLKKGASEVKEGASDVAAMAKERAANIRAEAAKDDETTTVTTTTTTKR